MNSTKKNSFSTNETNILSNQTEDGIDTNFFSEQSNSIPMKEQIDIKREIEFIELYNLTLKNYSKDFYNPCKYFFINKFQNNKIEDDLNRILMKTCDFDENVDKYNLNKLNNGEEKNILKDVYECCSNSNFKKLKCIFSHYKLNPNFFYSDLIENFNNQTSIIDLTTIQSNILLNNGGSNQRTSLNNSNPLIPRQASSSNRVGNNNVANFSRDKVFNLYSYLKSSKDKSKISEMIKYLMDEYNYLPLKVESDTNFDVKFARDIDWKINLKVCNC